MSFETPGRSVMRLRHRILDHINPPERTSHPHVHLLHTLNDGDYLTQNYDMVRSVHRGGVKSEVLRCLLEYTDKLIRRNALAGRPAPSFFLACPYTAFVRTWCLLPFRGIAYHENHRYRPKSDKHETLVKRRKMDNILEVCRRASRRTTKEEKCMHV